MTYTTLAGTQRRAHPIIKAAILLCLTTAAWALFGAAFFVLVTL